MKKLRIFVIFLIAACASCKQHKHATITGSGTEVVQPRTPAASDAPLETTKSAVGVVTEINLGKDGYTAKIRTADDETMAVTISRSNLKDPQQYKSVQVGDTLRVTGDAWIMESQQQITVREIN